MNVTRKVLFAPGPPMTQSSQPGQAQQRGQGRPMQISLDDEYPYAGVPRKCERQISGDKRLTLSDYAAGDLQRLQIPFVSQVFQSCRQRAKFFSGQRLWIDLSHQARSRRNI